MGTESHDQNEHDEDEPKSDDDHVDEASDESFPASDPPSFGSAEPG
jgi:hypothetical protein